MERPKFMEAQTSNGTYILYAVVQKAPTAVGYFDTAADMGRAIATVNEVWEAMQPKPNTEAK